MGSMDPGIVYFNHCAKYVFCFRSWDKCPICEHDLSSLPSLLFVSLPYPFIRASQQPGSVIIKPTQGDFLNDYNDSSSLHIALTTSTGVIVEFDEFGLRNNGGQTWEQCLHLFQVENVWLEHWDSIVESICEQSCWKPENYNELTNNCFTFVLRFLQLLAHPKLKGFVGNKTSFCQQFIIPKTTVAGKYISIYRKLKCNRVCY